MKKHAILVVIALLSGLVQAACEISIAVNQVGYLPEAPKWCRCEQPPAKDYAIFTIGTDVVWRCVWRGDWKAVRPGAPAVEADFSDLRQPGDYLILSGTNVAETVPCWIPSDCAEARSLYFVIRTNVYDTVERSFLYYYTWQRCGSKKGWTGLCHQDRCPLVGTDRTIDVRGGYHQSCDLRNWGDGISMSVYALLRYAETARPLWDEGQIRDEVRWGCDYFLKLVGPEGYAYDAQFTPIGWGPRRYYVVPAAFGAQANIAMLLARAAVYFKDDKDYAAQLVGTARRVFEQMETNPFFDCARPSPEPNLPAGAQPAERFYPQNYRTSATGLAGRSIAALELYRTTGEKEFADLALKYGRALVALQIPDGANAGAYRLHASTNALGFADCGYTRTIHGERTPLELFRSFGGDVWRTAALRTADRIKAKLVRQAMLPGDPKSGGSAQAAGSWSLYLNECAELFGRDDLRPYAQRTLDWVYGANPMLMSYIEGVGHNQRQRPVFGQFFPSTPQIPGAMIHTATGEYDMPAVAMVLWATHRLQGHLRKEIGL